MEIGDGAIIKCNYELCVKVVNKSIIQSTTTSIVTNTRDITFVTHVHVLAVQSHQEKTVHSSS
jgi:hypothetical protein